MLKLGPKALLAALLHAPVALAQVPVGTPIVNVATVEFVGSGGAAREATSNPVEFITAIRRTSAAVELLRHAVTAGTPEPVGPTLCPAGGGALGPPVTYAGDVLDPGAPQPLVPAAAFHAGEAVFIRVTDGDQNLDGSVRDRVEVRISMPATGDTETVELTETEPASGVFTGYLPTTVDGGLSGDCVLNAARGAALAVEYSDPADPADRADATAALDPVGRVFDALTGAPVEAAAVTIVDAGTGRPAVVYGDDGVSRFPSTVTTGADVVDDAGNRYSMAPGEFRFPIVPPGDYRFEVEPPTGYAAPSTRTETELQSLTGAPFLLFAGSYGGMFSVGPTPLVAMDVPVDPSQGDLFLTLTSSTAIAAAGDIVEFRLAVSHAGGLVSAEDVVVRNALPPGLKFAPGTAFAGNGGQSIVPVVGDDGRSLEFSIGSLPAGETFEITYVAHVAPLGGRQSELVNSAQAFAADGESNDARVRLALIDDFFTDTAFIAGRVLVGSCDVRGDDAAEQAGFAGVRVYLEDGRFAVTDEGGRYHFEGLTPGTHVVQLDVDSIGPEFELVDCDALASAGSLSSRFIDLAPGQFKRADFAVARKPPLSGTFNLRMSQTVSQLPGGDRYEFTIDVGTDDAIPADELQLMMLLPAPLRFEDAATGAGPLAADVTDQVVVLPLGTRDGPWTEQVVVRAVSDLSAEGDLQSRALLRFTFDGERQSTPVVETSARVTPRVQVGRNYVFNLNFETLSATLSAEDRARLDEVVPELRGVSELRLEAVGHSDSVPISARSRSAFADNYALSAARAESVVGYLAAALALDAGQISFTGVGPDKPVASNATAEGRRLNRRVELTVTGRANAAERKLESVQSASQHATLSVVAEDPALPPMAPSAAPDRAPPSSPVRPDAYDVATLDGNRDWLWPPEDHMPAIPNTKVAVKHRADDRVELTLNGAPVSPLNFEGADSSAATDVVVSRWRGLDLRDGGNELAARIVGADGASTTLVRNLHFAGGPVRAELLTEQSVLVADGRSKPLLALRLEDRWGKPAREGATGQFSIGGPYRSQWEVERLRDNPIVATADQTPTYIVGRDGLALIELEPTTNTGQVELTLRYANEQEQTFRAYVEPGDRDWILVGLAEGTIAYNKVSGNVELGAANGIDADYYDEGRLAFYAKGRVKGALLTAAFDSNGERDERLDPFGGTIDPDRYYTIYGDNTEQRFDAPTRDRLYVKIERGTLLAMVGDFETGLTVTELGRYSRSMTGFRSERHGDRVDYAVFAARADHAYKRDELRGDGTSGPYPLSTQGILAGSDKVVIEARDRFRSDRITGTRTLRRHFDYDIDYVGGAIYLREPLASRDFDFNPVYLVVDYETDTVGASTGVVAGGRVAVAVGSPDSEVGVTLIDDATAGAEGQLVGADLRYFVTRDLEVNAELASSKAESLTDGDRSGDAYLVEVAHRTGTRQIEAYVRETDSGFGLGQQRTGEPGTRRSGVALRNELGPAWRVEADAFRQRNTADGAERTVVEAESRYEDPARTAAFGLRRIAETLSDQSMRQDQAFVSGSWRFFDDLLTTRVSVEDTLTEGRESIDYPTRTVLGADVGVGSRVNLFGEHEIASGDAGDLVMTRFGIRASPTRGNEIDTSVQRTMTEYGPRSFANLGMRQSFMLGERWALDFGGERSTLLDVPAERRLDDRLPPASGEPAGDFSAGYFGVAYRAPAWSFTSRLEYRETDEDRRHGLIGSFYREQVEGRGFTAEMRLLDQDGFALGQTFSGSLRVGWGYRPAASRWMLFNRADWIAESRTLADSGVRNRRFVNNFNAHYALGQRQEIALKYSLKAVTASFDAAETRGLLDLLGVEWRRRLAPRYDIGLHATHYRAVDGDVTANGFGVDVGIEVAKNFNLLVGYNVRGFDDADFSRAHYTARGPFVQFKLKVDQASLRELLRR